MSIEILQQIITTLTAIVMTLTAQVGALTPQINSTSQVAQVSAPSTQTYYISPSGNDSNSCATAQSISTPKKTLSSGFSCLTPGATLILRNGSYSSISGIPNGSAGNYITVKAENDGGVIVSGLNMDHTDAYIQFEGLRFQSSNEKNILGNHIKFFRTEFKGGCSSC